MSHAIVNLTGAVGAAPQFRTRQDGRPVATFEVVTSRWRTRRGQREQVTDRHPVVIYNPEIIACVREFHPGDQVAVTGALQIRSFTGHDRVVRTVSEVVLQPRHGSAVRIAPLLAAL